MQYQTKWMKNMLKLFASRQSSLIRTLLVAGLLIGCLGVAFAGLSQSLLNAQARSATPQHLGQARSVSITVSSHIDHLRVIYTLIIHTAAHASTIRRGIPITFTDSIPVGLSQISAKGNHWDTKVSSKVGASLVTGTYLGSYPISPGATLPAVSIEGTINHHASNVLTNCASVNVWGNTDKTHSKAVVSDNIKSTLSSLPLLNSNEKSSICYKRCDIGKNNSCDNNCKQQISNTCDKSCISSQMSSSNTCDKSCAQESEHTSVQQQVHVSVYESESTDTSRQGTDNGSTDTGQQGTDNGSTDTGQQGTNNGSTDTGQQGTNNGSTDTGQQGTDNGSTGTPSNVANNGPKGPNGTGSTTPFPTLPNTGSNPNSKG